MYPLIDWPNESPKLFERNGQQFLICEESDAVLRYSKLHELLDASHKFPIKFPIDTGKCSTLKREVAETILLRNANSSYPLLHESVLPLFIDFILHKRKYGSAIEKHLYKDMNMLEFIDRLLKKRAIMVMGRYDDYILLNGVNLLTYSEFIKSKDRSNPEYFKEVGKGVYFDNVMFSKRIGISIDTLLFEANHRAKERNTTAFVHVIGIGLGVWKCSVHQEEIFMETFAKRIDSCGKYKHGSKIPIVGHPKDGIRVFVSQRQPHEALTGENKGKLLVVSYAWDGNALPGNEFWNGKLASTGDSAAASSTQIAELHNPHINRNVCAKNLKIAAEGRIYHFKDYIQCNLKRKRDNDSSTSK